MRPRNHLITAVFLALLLDTGPLSAQSATQSSGAGPDDPPLPVPADTASFGAILERTTSALDSLRARHAAEQAALAHRLGALQEATERWERSAVLGALVPYLDRYIDALRQPVILVSSRRAALVALTESLRATERDFAAALQADALEVSRLRVLLERAATGALLSELTGIATVP